MPGLSQTLLSRLLLFADFSLDPFTVIDQTSGLDGFSEFCDPSSKLLNLVVVLGSTEPPYQSQMGPYGLNWDGGRGLRAAL